MSEKIVENTDENSVCEQLKRRRLPDVLSFEDGRKVENKEMWLERRAEISEILQHNYCGYEPPIKPQVTGIVTKEDNRTAFAGKALYQKIDIQCKLSTGSFTFPCHFVKPKNIAKPPVFVYLSFSDSFVDELLPVEEIIDEGFAVASFYYQNIAPDTDDNFMNGIALSYGRNPFDAWGKVRMWAWGASRVMDYITTRDDINIERTAVVGHSRLGKAALVCGAFDERFSLVISNDSGGAGAAIFRGKQGEMVKNFRGGTSGHWFAGNFRNYVRREDEMPFDMHYLLSMIAPRNLYVCSAIEDLHADPRSEYLSCVAAGKVYEIFDKSGFVACEVIPDSAASFHEGNIGYHIREGHHFLSRYDWKQFIEYRNNPLHIC